MKRKLFIIFIALFSVFSLCLKEVYAKERIIEKPYSILDQESFNVFMGYIEQTEFDDEGGISHYNYYIAKYVESGYIESRISGTIDLDTHQMIERCYIEDGILSRLQYYFDDTLFYDAKCTDYSVNVIVDNEIWLYDIYNDYGKVFVKNNIETDYSHTNFINDERDIINNIKYYRFINLYTSTVKENTYYDGYDCHIVMSYNNKLTEAEILEEVVIDDSSLTKLKVIENEYDYNESQIGSYKMKLIAMDEYNHYTVQDVLIDVLDVIDPVVSQKRPLIVEYNTILDEDTLIDEFQIIEDHEYTYEFDFTNYNKNILGTYTLSLTVTDIYDNSTNLDFDIIVTDTKAPNIGFAIVAIDNLEKRNIEEIKDAIQLSVYDEYDGNVSNLCEVIDLDDYENNYMKTGIYRFKINAYDSHSNYSSGIATIRVLDADYPSIQINKYLVLTEKGGALSKDDVKNVFNNLGYNLTNNDIEGDCFNLTSLEGEYDFTYKLDDNINIGLVSTEEVDSIIFPYEVTDIENNTLNITIIIVISISCLILVSSITFGIILYKKRH